MISIKGMIVKFQYTLYFAILIAAFKIINVKVFFPKIEKQILLPESFAELRNIEPLDFTYMYMRVSVCIYMTDI